METQLQLADTAIIIVIIQLVALQQDQPTDRGAIVLQEQFFLEMQTYACIPLQFIQVIISATQMEPANFCSQTEIWFHAAQAQLTNATQHRDGYASRHKLNFFSFLIFPFFILIFFLLVSYFFHCFLIFFFLSLCFFVFVFFLFLFYINLIFSKTFIK